MTAARARLGSPAVVRGAGSRRVLDGAGVVRRSRPPGTAATGDTECDAPEGGAPADLN